MHLSITDTALDYLADVGFDPVYGARPLKRTIQRELETPVARGILKGEFDDKDTILVDEKDGTLVITKAIDGVVTEKEESMSGAFD